MAKQEFSCIASAREQLEQLGGPSRARIYWVTFPVEGEEPVGHAFVIPKGAESDSLPLNRRDFLEQGARLRVGDILREGTDRTEEFLALPESMI